LALEKDLLLVTDDLPTREFGRRFGVSQSTWLQAVLIVAHNKKKLDFDKYVRWTANLIDAGHNYVGVSGQVLVRAALMDAENGKCPGYFFGQVVKMLGGTPAEVRSHIRVAVEFLQYAWGNPAALPYRENATGVLLQNLVRDRSHDRREILRVVKQCARTYPTLVRYLTVWSRGSGANSNRSPDALEGSTKTVNNARTRTVKSTPRDRDRAWREAQKRKPKTA
jgi:hypothetical protein